MRRAWKTVGSAGASCLAVLLLSACTNNAVPPTAIETVIPVTLAAASAADGQSSLGISGIVRLKRETPLGFNTAGRIAAITVHEGDEVARGQILARLDPTSLVAVSSSARAEAARADADYRRLASLYAKGWVTAPRVETARAAAAAAQARVSQAGFDVGLATIRAPSSGVVLRRPAEPGQMATPGQTILLLGERAAGYVLRLPLADADLGRIRVGQRATVTIPALGAAPINAIVSEIGARGDDATGTFRVELALPQSNGLRSGLIGAANFRFAGSSPTGGAVTVPATAVFSARADEGFVYVHDAATGRVKLRQVALGPLGNTALTITSGLRRDEMVVTSGADRLRDGVKVRVQAPARG